MIETERVLSRTEAYDLLGEATPGTRWINDRFLGYDNGNRYHVLENNDGTVTTICKQIEPDMYYSMLSGTRTDEFSFLEPKEVVGNVNVCASCRRSVDSEYEERTIAYHEDMSDEEVLEQVR
jgi:hypothetical protein